MPFDLDQLIDRVVGEPDWVPTDVSAVWDNKAIRRAGERYYERVLNDRPGTVGFTFEGVRRVAGLSKRFWGDEGIASAVVWWPEKGKGRAVTEGSGLYRVPASFRRASSFATDARHMWPPTKEIFVTKVELRPSNPLLRGMLPSGPLLKALVTGEDGRITLVNAVLLAAVIASLDGSPVRLYMTSPLRPIGVYPRTGTPLVLMPMRFD